MKEDNSEKLGALIKLGVWLLFIGILVIVAKVGGNDNNINLEKTENEIKEETKKDENVISYEDKLNNLINNYKYTYEVKIDNDIFLFEGVKKEKNNFVNESGKYTLNGEFKYNYYLENNYTYQVNNGGLDKIDTIYDSRINIDYLDVLKIKGLIFNKEYTNEEENKYVYKLENEEVIIYTNLENIEKIEINVNENYYKLSISDIGKITEVIY